MTYGFQFLALLVAAVVIANVLARRRQAARGATTTNFARQRGLVPAGDVNPLLGAYALLPPPPGVGVAPERPYVLEAIASGRGTVRNALRGRTAAGEVVVLDYQMPPDGDRTPPRFATWAGFRAPGVPTFRLFPRPRFVIGLKTLEFDAAPALARRFTICSADEAMTHRAWLPVCGDSRCTVRTSREVSYPWSESFRRIESYRSGLMDGVRARIHR